MKDVTDSNKQMAQWKAPIHTQAFQMKVFSNQLYVLTSKILKMYF